MFPEDRFLEILIIGALALIVIGPKDLPVVMRKLGKAVGKMRAMAAEFRASFDELARQSELDDLRKEVEALRHSQTAGGSGLNPLGEVHTALNEMNQEMTAAPAVAPEPEPEAVAAEPAKTAGEAP